MHTHQSHDAQNRGRSSTQQQHLMLVHVNLVTEIIPSVQIASALCVAAVCTIVPFGHLVLVA